MAVLLFIFMIRKQLYRYINLKAMVLSLPGAPIEEGSGKGKKDKKEEGGKPEKTPQNLFYKGL